MADKIYTIKESTLTGMANALRSGLGDIGPIKGDELEARTLEVVGMIGSGGGGTLVGATGEFVATGTTMTVNHNLGTVPVFFLVRTSMGYTSPASRLLYFACGFSQAGADAIGVSADKQYCAYYASATYLGQGTPDYAIDTAEKYIPLRNATENSITVGYNNDYDLQPGTCYSWLAFGLKEE